MRLRDLWAWLFPREASRAETALRAVALIVFLVLVVRTWRSAVAGSYDFDGFHREARFLLEQRRISTNHSVERYLPQFQVFHVPFALLHVGVAGVLWLLLSVAALLALPRLLERLSGVAPRDQAAAWLAMLPFVIGNLHLGQSAPVLLWASLLAIDVARRHRELTAGAVLSLVAQFKLTALPLVAPVLLLGRPLRTLAGLALAVGLGVGLLVVAVGPEETLRGTGDWYRRASESYTPARMVELDRSLRVNNQSLPISLARTFGDLGAVKVKNAPKLASLPLPVIWSAVTAIIVALGLLGLAVIVRARRDGVDREAWLVVTSLCALGTLFISPIVWTHYFLWALPGVIALRARPRTLIALGLFSVACQIWRPARGVGAHLWLSMALYLVVALRYLTSTRRTSKTEPAVS